MWSQVKGQRDYLVISMQCVYKRYLSFLILEMNSSNMDGDVLSHSYNKVKKALILKVKKALIHYFKNECFVQSSPCPERADGGSFYRVSSLSAERQMRRNSPSSPRLESCHLRIRDFILLWSWGGIAAQGPQVADGRSLNFPWHCRVATLTMGPSTFGLQNGMGT